MEYARLKHTDLRISRIGLGCSLFASVTVPRSESEITATVHAALDAGINFFDTADSYGLGDSERRLGRAVRKRRDKAIIATKAGYRLGRTGGMIRAAKPLIKSLAKRLPGIRSAVRTARSAMIQQDFSPSYVRASLEASLRRLQTDYVDMFWLHNPPIEAIRNEALLDSLDAMVRAGKTRHWGVSCQRATDTLAAIECGTAMVFQLPIHVGAPEACGVVLPKLVQAGCGIVAREVFASGLIASPPADLAALLAKTGLSPRHAAMRFALVQTGVDTMLIGMSRSEHVVDNCAMYQAPELSADDRAALAQWRRPDVETMPEKWAATRPAD